MICLVGGLFFLVILHDAPLYLEVLFAQLPHMVEPVVFLWGVVGLPLAQVSVEDNF